MKTLAFITGMPGVGEIALVLLILILLFGARRIPDIARSLGRSITEFKKGRHSTDDVPPGDETNQSQDHK